MPERVELSVTRLKISLIDAKVIIETKVIKRLL